MTKKANRSPNETRAFRRSLLRWYRKHGRDLPWRQTRDPYAILVSEIMLQQTQVATVLPYFREWLRRFPDFGALARAHETEVLHAWQGLGYYSRARNLHAAAKVVEDRHSGIFPREPNTIGRLPGIGRYTANAVRTFAFDHSVPIVEANTARLLARLFNIRASIDSGPGRERLWQLAAALVPGRAAGEFNSALIDLGALVCVARRPKCSICPVKDFCRAPDPESLPKRKPRPKTKALIECHAFINRRNMVLLEQSSTRWRGMWILPRLNPNAKSSRPIHTSVFPFTNHRVTLQVFRLGSVVPNPHYRWTSIDLLDAVPIPSPHRRALVDLLR